MNILDHSEATNSGSHWEEEKEILDGNWMNGDALTSWGGCNNMSWSYFEGFFKCVLQLGLSWLKGLAVKIPSQMEVAPQRTQKL